MTNIKSIKEICRILADQIAFEANNDFNKTGELHNERQVIADMLNDIAEYKHSDKQ